MMCHWDASTITVYATENTVPETMPIFVAKHHERNVIMQDNEPALYTSSDMCRIFKIPKSSLYRKLREARGGHGGLPLPLPSKKQGDHLRWNAESVRTFCSVQCEAVQPVPTLPKSTTERQRRLNAALKDISAMER